MNKDFRVSVAFTDHPKTIKLMRRLGDRAFFSLIKFWGYVAINKPNGKLKGVDAEDIEIAADWRGEQGVFVSTLLDLGFLEQGEEFLCVHDWEEHNEFATYSKERSEKARAAARTRWGNSKKSNGVMPKDATSNATSISKQCGGDAQNESSNAPSPIPSPIPIPSPSLKTTTLSATTADPHTKEENLPISSVPNCPHEKIIELYHELLPVCPPVKSWGKTGRSKLQARWREDPARRSLSWWRDYFVSISGSDFLTGKTPPSGGRACPFLASLDWLVSPSNMEKVINGKYENHGVKSSGSSLTDRNMQVAMEWAQGGAQ